MLEVGDFVVSSENDDGIGKIVALQKDRATVEYFYSIGKTQRVPLPLQSLRPIFPLPKQTRCYFRDEYDGSWRVGRIGVGVSDTHEVLLPEQKRLVVSNDRLYVRCSHPVDDPLLEILLHKGHETPRFHDWRFGFVSALLRQRAASRGMSGLISSKIELFPHQVEVVRRVLEDPIQRYLLADEVGLGKTIEAGAILRQYLLDDPDGVALVIVPSLLLRQWEDELRTKFDLDAKDERIVLASIDDLPKPKKSEHFGMLIIDEAQHATGGAFSSDAAARKSFRTFSQLCEQIPRLLLLSATPVLHHEKAFLAMLHLLDAEQYQLKDAKKFARRVQNRQALGRLMLTFTENSSTFALKSSLRKLMELFRGEKAFKKRCKELEKLLAATPPDPDAIKQLVRTLRTQAAEGLRVHRRMLRTRRESIDPALLIERSMQAKDLHPEPDMGSETETLHRLLEDWRKAAWTHAQTLSPEERADYAKIYLLLIQTAATWEELFKDLINARKNRDRKGAAISDSITHAFSPETLAPLLTAPHFTHEKDLLQSLAKIFEHSFEDGDRLDLLMLLIKPFLSGSKPGQKAVVFSSFTPTAQAILKRIRREGYNESKFAGHTRGMPRKEFEKSLEQFRAKPDCTVFVGDATCEEGLNLQFATHAIHFDLPLHPNRLEQRIGRLDRIARSNPLTTTVLTGPDIETSPQAAWFELLRDGLGIFEKSIASLQFFVESLLPQIESALFENGAAGLRELKEKMPGALAAERLRIAEQEVLDSIDIQDQDAKDFHKRLEEDDQRYDAFRRGVHGWVHDGLRFGVKQGSDVVEYFVDRGTLIPAGTVVRRLSPPSKRRGTFRRVKAVYGEDLCLFRIGEPFIDALAAFTDWDDRGQAFAMWRQIPSFARGKEILAFRLNYIVELNLAKLDAAIAALKLPELAAKSFKRQGDALFPPQIHTLFMDIESRPITDPALLQFLNPPFSAKKDGGNDYNLAKERLPLLDKLVSSTKWERVCPAVRKASEETLRHSPDFKSFCAQKLSAAERETYMQLEQLKLRGRKGDRAINLSHEKKLREALLEGIRAPRIKLDSCGFYVVAGRAPEA